MKKISIARITLLLLVTLGIATTVAWFAGLLPRSPQPSSSNAILVIAPYKYAGTWVFDDPSANLHREPFVSGVPEIIDAMTSDIPDADKGFRLLFSTGPFPGHTHSFTWLRGDRSGNWYYCDQTKTEGWLCPGLFKYYNDAPKTLYAKAEQQ